MATREDQDILEREGIASARDLLEYMLRGSTRMDVLEAIDGWTPRSELLNEHGFNASSLTNTIRDLEELEFVYQDDSGETRYRLTPLGELIDESLETEVNTVSDYFHLYPFLHQVPRWDERLCNIEHLRDAEVTVNQRLGPNQAVDRFKEAIADAASIEEQFHRTIVSDFYLDQFRDDALEGRFYVGWELVQEVRDVPSSMENWREYERLGVEFSAVEDPFPFTLTLFTDADGDQAIGIFPSEEQETDVFLYSSNDSAVAWADQVFADYRETGERVRPDDT